VAAAATDGVETVQQWGLRAPSANRKYETAQAEAWTVSTVAEEGLEPPTRGL
jgi:hypothetical protein